MTKKFQQVINSNLFIVVALVLSRVLIDYIYISDVSPKYSYRGLTYSYSLWHLVLSWIVLAIFIRLILHLVNRKNNESEKGAVLINILLCCSAVPTTTIIACFNLDILFSVLLIVYWSLIVFLYGRRNKNKLVIRGFAIKQTKILFYIITAVFALNLIFIIFRYTGVSFNFNLIDVYDARSTFKSDRIPTILRYLFYGSTMAFPIVVIYTLNARNMLLASIASICQILAFFVDGRKVTLFMLILTVAGYLFIKNFNVRLIPFGSFGLILIGCLEKWILHTNFFINYIVRRLYILPAYLQYAYYDYFSSNQKDFFRQSIIGRIGFTSPYDSQIPNVVGMQYYGGSYANNGLFADAYANFGFLGAVLFPFLIVWALKLLDRCCGKLSMGVCMGIIFSLSSALLSSSFFTVMLTHGYLICCIIAALMPMTTNSLVKRNKSF